MFDTGPKLPDGALFEFEAKEFLYEISESPIEYTFLKSLVVRNRHLVLTKDAPDWIPGAGDTVIQPQAYRAPYRLDVEIAYRRPNGTIGRIDLECDGYKFHSTAEQIARDRKRNEHFESLGYLVWRYPGWLINRAADVVADEVDRAVEMLISGKTPTLVFESQSQKRKPSWDEWETAYRVFEDTGLWMPRFGDTPEQRKWVDVNDMTDWLAQQDGYEVFE